jgi:hypothetical protein
MADAAEGKTVAAEEFGQYDQVETQMRERDAYLARRLRRARIFVRTLDIGFGYYPRWRG